jgi:trehalose synthase
LSAEPNPAFEACSLEEVELSRYRADGLESVLATDAWRSLQENGKQLAALLEGRRFWHLNSTAHGGGVAELLTWLLPLARSAGIDARRLTLSAPAEFFELTKGIHHLLHESGKPLAANARQAYEHCLDEAARSLMDVVEPGDIVVVHDPQPAGLIPAAVEAGAVVVWRCHIGTDNPGRLARSAWEFLRPYVELAQVLIFSRRSYVWTGVDESKVRIVQPAIDPLAPKNQPLSDDSVAAILQTIGLLEGRPDAKAAAFTRLDGSAAKVDREADILQEAPIPASAAVVCQVSRWDPLKDPVGVIDGFTRRVSDANGAHLVLAGPATKSVEDDPEGARMFELVRQRWEGLTGDERTRVHVAALPMDEPDENAAMVNALQRHSAVIVQKSLEEGFGLTVVEAMWKARPIVASAVGGILEQIEDDVSGLLVDDPRDLHSFGEKVARLLDDDSLAHRLGDAAQAKTRKDFLPDRAVRDWLHVIQTALEE